MKRPLVNQLSLYFHSHMNNLFSVGYDLEISDGGGGVTRPLPRDGGVEELYGARGGPKSLDNFPERSDHPVTPIRLEFGNNLLSPSQVYRYGSVYFIETDRSSILPPDF